MSTQQIGARPGESGTTVERVEPSPARVESPFGTTLIVGGFAWGDVDTVLEHPGVGDYLARRATPVVGDLAAVCAEHFLQRAAGAGTLLTLRLTDDHELTAYRDVYARDVSRSYLCQTAYSPPTKVLRFSGAYAGARGGRFRYHAGYLANLNAAFSGAAGTFATAETMLTNQWAGARLYLEGSSRSYIVRSNNTAGLLVIECPANDAGPTPVLAAPAGTYEILLPITDADGVAEGIAVRIDASQRSPGAEFGVLLVDLRTASQVAPEYPSLTLDSTRDEYVDDRVGRDLENGVQYLVDVASESVGDPGDDAIQPANWVGLVHPDSVAGATLVLQAFCWTRTSPLGGDAYLDGDYLTLAYSDVPRHKIVLTFTGVAAFDVSVYDWEGDTRLDDGDLPAGTLGAAYAFAYTRFARFRVYAGANPMAADDVIAIYVNGVPPQAATGGYLYPHGTDDVAGDLRTRLPIVSRTWNSVTVQSSIDLVADHGVVIPTRPTSTCPTAETYDMSVPANRAFTYSLDGEADVTLTTLLVGAAETATALAASLEALAAAATPQRVTFTTDTAGTRIVSAATRSYGASASLVIRTAGMGAILGYAVDTTVTGTSGSVVALTYDDDLQFGYDGHHLLGSGTEYTDAFHVLTSPINAILRDNYGLVKVALPGVATAAAQEAAIAYCAGVGYEFRAEIAAASATTEAGAAKWRRTNLTGDENCALAWDSYGYPRVRPYVGTEVLVPLTGAILGAEAALAAAKGGYHVAAAGPKNANIGGIFRALASSTPGVAPYRKDERTLNAAGIQAVQQVGTVIYPNGDWNPADLYRGTVWKHKVECVLHLMHLLTQVGDRVVWEPNDPSTRRNLEASVAASLIPLYDAGWFRREAGQTFWDVVRIAAGDDENPPAVTVLGQLRCVVEVSGIVDAAMRVVFALGTGGVTASTLAA